MQTKYDKMRPNFFLMKLGLLIKKHDEIIKYLNPNFKDKSYSPSSCKPFLLTKICTCICPLNFSECVDLKVTRER